VRIAPRQGVTVSRLSISKVRAMLEFIGELEALCAKLAARRVDDELRQQLDEAVHRCQQAAVEGGAADYAVANSFFHEAVYAGSRNPYLAEQVRSARRSLQRLGDLALVLEVPDAVALQDHLHVARAIQAGDEEAAAKAMLLHVPAGTTGFSEFLATVPMNFFETEPGAEA